MGLKKFGTGDGVILPEKEDNQKTAKENWTPADEQALREENKDKKDDE